MAGRGPRGGLGRAWRRAARTSPTALRRPGGGGGGARARRRCGGGAVAERQATGASSGAAAGRQRSGSGCTAAVAQRSASGSGESSEGLAANPGWGHGIRLLGEGMSARANKQHGCRELAAHLIDACVQVLAYHAVAEAEVHGHLRPDPARVRGTRALNWPRGCCRSVISCSRFTPAAAAATVSK